MSKEWSEQSSGKKRALREKRRELLNEQEPEHYCPSCESVTFETESRCLNCGTDRPSEGWPDLSKLGDPWLGRTIADRYFISRPLGQGTSGAVYRAESLSISREFAVKIISTDDDQQDAQQVVQRLEREIEALSRLRNPHIVSFYECFDLADGFVAAVMDLIEGDTLEALINEGGALDLKRGCALLRQTANGIYEAHQAGMIHRDLKPENLMIERLPAGDDFVHILDFGIVRLGDETNVNLTQGFIGTPLYASPEQAMGKDVDHRSDIYSLGAICFFMLTGRPPFESQNVYKVLRQHVREQPPSLSEVGNQTFPHQFEELVEQMLAKRPEDRPDDLDRVIDELDAIAKSADSREQNAGADADPADSSPDSPKRTLDPEDRNQRQTPGSGILKVPEAAQQQTGRDSDESGDSPPVAESSDQDNEFTSQESNSSATIQAYREQDHTDTPAFQRSETPAETGTSDLEGEISFHGTGDSSSAATAISSATHQLNSSASQTEAAYRPADNSFAIYERDPGQLLLFGPDGGEPTPVTTHHSGSIEALDLSEDHLVVGYDDGTISRLSPDDGTEQKLYQDVRRAPLAAVATDESEDCIAAGSTSGRVYVHHSDQSGSSDWQRFRDGKPVRSITVNDSTDTIGVARQDNTVEIIGVSNPRVPTATFSVDAPIRSMAISPDDYLMAAALVDRSVALYQLPRGRRMLSLAAEHVDVLSVEFNDEGQPVTVCSVDRRLRLLKFDEIGSKIPG